MKFKKLQLALNIVLCAVIVMLAGVYPGKSFAGMETSTPQDPASLDRRISLLEQRFYMIESNINRLQQSLVAQRAPGPTQSVSAEELNLVREEIQRLRLRVTEIECGVVKLDERTATRRAGEGKPADPCRLNPAAPVRLSTRP